LGTLPDEEVAQRVGRSVAAVMQKRIKLGIVNPFDGTKKRGPRRPRRTWGNRQTDFGLIDVPIRDEMAVECLGRGTVIASIGFRTWPRIPNQLSNRWTAEAIVLLGTMLDRNVARLLARPLQSVTQKRCKMGIVNPFDWRHHARPKAAPFAIPCGAVGLCHS
jgi:hypothetical protein